MLEIDEIALVDVEVTDRVVATAEKKSYRRVAANQDVGLRRPPDRGDIGDGIGAGLADASA